MKNAKHSRVAQKKKSFPIVVKVFFTVEILVFFAGIVYMAVTKLIPLKYILAATALGVILCGLHILFLKSKKHIKTTRVLSLILSIIILLLSVFGVYFLGVVHSSFIKIPDKNTEVNAVKVGVDVEPFIVYLSGLDTRGTGKIREKGLSDVNMTIVINPKTAQVLMVNTPRDYYVPLWGDTNKMDKLTHAGNYGVECSMKTLEALYGIKYNYYVKVNFKSLIDIVDALGGVTVDSELAFSSHYNLLEDRTYHFVKGENQLTGDAALAFARERESIPGGDRQRGRNQQIVIKAIINKATSPAMLNPAKISQLVSCVTENTTTNISYDEISKLTQMQLNKMPSWDIQTLSVDGTGAYAVTYSGGSAELSVIMPDQKTIDIAKSAIQNVMNGIKADYSSGQTTSANQ